MPIRIVPKKKPNRVYMTDDNSGVIYSDKKGNVISKEQAMKGFDDADAAERREERRSSQYKKMLKGGLTGGQKKLDINNDGKISGEDFKILKGKNNKMKGGGIAIKGTNFKGVF